MGVEEFDSVGLRRLDERPFALAVGIDVLVDDEGVDDRRDDRGEIDVRAVAGYLGEVRRGRRRLRRGWQRGDLVAGQRWRCREARRRGGGGAEPAAAAAQTRRRWR